MNIRLARKNKEVDIQSWDALYGRCVTVEVRKVYSQDKIEAIINNYLDDPLNEKYAKEFKALQEYRKQCKAKVKVELGIEEDNETKEAQKSENTNL
jgi:hypothetical protein